MRQNSSSDTFFEYFIYLLTLVLSGFIIYSPLARGLFFREDYLRFFPWIAWACLALVVAGLFRWEAGKRFWHWDVDLSLFLVVCLYWLSTFWAVSKAEAFNGAIKYTSYFLTFLMARFLGQTPLANRLLRNALVISGVTASLVGLLSAAGVLKYPSAVVSGKIYGSFQYPNALAAYAMFIFFLCVHAWSESSDFKKVWLRWIFGVVYALAAFTLSGVIILSYSRATWIIFAVSGLVYFALSPKGVRAKAISRFILSMAAIVSVNNPLAQSLLKNDQAVTRKYLLLGAALAVGLEIIRLLGSSAWEAVQKRRGQVLSQVAAADLPKNVKRRRVVYVSIVTMCILALVVIAAFTTQTGEKILGKIVPPSVVQRFKSISLMDQSLVIRFHATLDALRIGRDHPFGVGAGGWNALYHTYQRTLYWFTETHNHFAQILVETGFLGLFFYVIFWAGVLLALIKAAVRFYGNPKKSGPEPGGIVFGTQSNAGWFFGVLSLGAAVFSLGLHSSADFDLSLPSISLSLFAAIGLFLSHVESVVVPMPSVASLGAVWSKMGLFGGAKPGEAESNNPSEKSSKGKKTQKSKKPIPQGKRSGQKETTAPIEDLSWVLPAVGLLLLCAMAVFIIKPSGSYFRGMAYGGAGVYALAKGNTQQGRDYLLTAMKYDPHTSNYAMDLARTYAMDYQREKDQGSRGMVKLYLDLAEKKNPLSLEDRANGALMLYTVGLYDDSVISAKKALALCPLNKELYDLVSNCMQSAIAHHLDAWQKAVDAKDDAAAKKEVAVIKEYIAYANGIPMILSGKKEAVKGTYAKVWNPNELNLTKTTSFLLGQASFLEGKNAEAVKYLSDAAKDNTMAGAANTWLEALGRAAGISVTLPKGFKGNEKSLEALSKAYGMAR